MNVNTHKWHGFEQREMPEMNWGQATTPIFVKYVGYFCLDLYETSNIFHQVLLSSINEEIIVSKLQLIL
jgi:hypothetical protein